MNIKDPKAYPWEADSPYEIYAAGRWFGSRDDPAWQARARRWAELNSPVYRGNLSATGVSAPSLVKDLFFLHLTVRNGAPSIFKALELLKTLEGSREHLGWKIEDIPFEPAEDPDFVIHAWLFNAAVFGEAAGRPWMETAARQGRRVQTEGDAWSSGSLYNFLRGTLIIPEAESLPGVVEAIRLLAARQESSGFLQDLAPWQVYNLMAHSAHPEALKILEKLEPPLLKLQNRDGSWGSGGQKPLAAFLMAHGLQNRGASVLRKYGNSVI